MEKICVFVIILIISSFEPLYSQQQLLEASIRDNIPNADFLLANTAQAKDFWLAVPLNQSKARPANSLELYVASIYNTTVTVEVPGSGFIQTKKIVANQTTVFTTTSGSFSWDFEILTFEVAENKAIHVFADKPISVYVVNSKSSSTDGFLALPTNSFGTDYIHCSYYDFFGSSSFMCGGGFVVIATEDATNVSITLKGRGAYSGAKTRGGSSIGDVINVPLSRGQIYNVIGDATTRGEFDLTGTRITSNKPIGLISYNESTYMPSNSSNGAEHLVEMLRPVTAWGKMYMSVEFDRCGRGDYFRVVASENNTKWKMHYYDMSTGTLIGQRSGMLQAGQFYEDFNSFNGGGSIAFRGITVWEADKPILVMQYGYSRTWDLGSDDPTMFMVTPTEQFVQSSIIQAPSNSIFTSNLFSFIVKGDPTDTNSTLLKSFTIDGAAVYKSYPQILLNRIPGTDYYWGRKKINGGFHVVTSETRFGGYMNAPFSPQANYSWPAATSTRAIDEFDNLPPVLTKTIIDEKATYQASETRNFTLPSGGKHVDLGIFDIFLIDSISYNFDLTLKTMDRIVPLPRIGNFEFTLSPQDSSKKGNAVFVVIDRAGNYTIDTFSFIPKTIVPNAIFAQHIDFGKVTLGDSKDSVISSLITNIGSVPLIVSAISIDSIQFSIATGDSIFTLMPGQSRAISLKFIPLSIGKITAHVLITHNGANSPTLVNLSGEGVFAVVPIIVTSKNIDVGKVSIGNTKDSLMVSLVKNLGTAALVVSSIQVTGNNASMFQIKTGSSFTLSPSDSKDISISFTPTIESILQANLIVNHNAANSPTIIPMTGEGVPPTSVSDGEIIPTPWKISLEGSTLYATCECTNLSTALLTLYDVLGCEVGSASIDNTGNTLSISTTAHSPGIYYAVVTIGGQLLKGQVIVVE